MAYIPRADLAALSRSVPDGVVRGATLRAAGVSGSSIETRCRPGGPWQRLLPGVLLLHNGPPTRRQLLRAALAYAGPGAVVTGVDALHAQGLTAAGEPEDVHLLLPAERRVSSRGFVIVERTTRPPCPVRVYGLLCAPVVRATLDAARRERDATRLSVLLNEPLRRAACTVAQLRKELDEGSQRGAAAPRSVLRSMDGHVQLPVHGWARRILLRCALPEPRWNTPVFDRSGGLLGVVDAWWDDGGLAWVLGAAGGAVPSSRGTPATSSDEHVRFAATGVTVLYTDPRRLRDDPDGVARELTAAYQRLAHAARRARGHPAITPGHGRLALVRPG